MFGPPRTSWIVKYEPLYNVSCKLYIDAGGMNIWEGSFTIFIRIYLINCIPIFIDENGFQEYDDTIVAVETGMQKFIFLCL